MVTEPFDGLPPKLDGCIDLGRDPAVEAARRCSSSSPTSSAASTATSIEGFGESLWDRAPAEFRAVYWALHDHYRRPLVIQFVSDDPHLPWELMRPYREGETHPPLALRHVVGRWIGRWNGYMRNRLAAGRLVTVAPKYASVSTRLSLAERTAAALVANFGAEAVGGTLEGDAGPARDADREHHRPALFHRPWRVQCRCRRGLGDQARRTATSPSTRSGGAR